MCHPCVSVCHPLKRCKPFIYRHCVSVSPFIQFFLVLYLFQRLKKLETIRLGAEKMITFSDPNNSDLTNIGVDLTLARTLKVFSPYFQPLSDGTKKFFKRLLLQLYRESPQRL